MHLRTSSVFDSNAAWFLKSGEAARLERILAIGRAVLAATALAGVSLDPTQPAQHSILAYSLLISYACLSFSFLIWVQWRTVEPRVIPIVHVIDFSIVALIGAFTPGFSGLLFVFFGFVVLAAAYRWGLRETVITGAAFWILYLIETLLVDGRTDGVLPTFYISRLAVGSTYVAVVTVLVGYLADRDRRDKEESTFVARILHVCQTDRGLTATVRTFLKTIADFYGAKGALLFIQENSNHRIFRWQYSATEDAPSSLSRDMSPDDGHAYLFAGPAPIWFWQQSQWKTGCHTTGFDNASISRAQFEPPQLFMNAVPCRTLLAATVVLGEDLAGRLYVVDPDVRWRPARKMRCLVRLLTEIGPVVHNIYLWRKVRARVHVIEQARAAREIHDGVIPFFLGLELEIETILLRLEQDAASRRELKRIQYMIRRQSQEVRDLMNRIKTPAPGPSELNVVLQNLVTKFAHETGIKARFVCKAEILSFSGETCHEIVRIVQEALINVRKHSRATQVEVALDSDQQGLDLIIQDNGPAAAATHATGADDDEDGNPRAWEPAVIRERVLLLKGSLRVESRPQSGVRLIIRIPTFEMPHWWTHGTADSAPHSPFIPFAGSSTRTRPQDAAPQ